MSKTTHGSSNGHGTTAQRLAVVQHERRQAIYEAGAASEPPPMHTPTLNGIGPARDKLPTLDDLLSDGIPARKARWRLVIAAVAGLVSLAEVARQLVALVAHK
jgi:hypothetical protein